MKLFIPTLVIAGLLSGAAGAQSINIGPGGVSVDPRSPQERAYQRDRAEERDIRRDERARERDREERRDRRVERRGDDCRTVITREETPRGLVRRETRVCD